MSDKKFDPKKLQKLNDPQRLVDIPPGDIRGRLNLQKADVLVEIGAGTAFFSIAFLKLFNAATLYACDLSETMIAWMKANVTPRHPTIIPVQNGEFSVPLDDGVADLVFMITLHHELENPAAMLEESYRLLKPGGEIFIVDWKKREMAQGPPSRIRCTPEQVRDQLIQAGFGGVSFFNDMPKHFLVVGQKGRLF